MGKVKSLIVRAAIGAALVWLVVDGFGVPFWTLVTSLAALWFVFLIASVIIEWKSYRKDTGG
jgi:hypothetical protein